MKTTTILTLALTLLSLALSAQYNCDNLYMESKEGQVASFTYQNLRVYPIYATSTFIGIHDDIGKHDNLKDAMEEKKISITEVDLGGSVNTLMAKNNSSDTVFVMAGEVVQGGKQDRVIAQDFIIEPGKEVDIGAFCVEKGRWQSDEVVSEVETMAAPAFEMKSITVSTKMRKTVSKEANQSAVWEEVDSFTQSNGVSSSTSTYNALLGDGAFQQKMEDYKAYFKDKLTGQTNIIGMVATTGDTVLGCDLFATHHLYANASESILEGHITEVITNGKAVTISDREVQSYLDEFLLDEISQEDVLDKKGTIYRHGGKKLHIAAY